MECQFCKNILSSKGTLKTHQSTTKYCLEIQNSLQKDKKEINVYKCSKNNSLFPLSVPSCAINDILFVTCLF